MEPNHNLVDGKNFLLKIIHKSLPGGLTVFLNIIIILLFQRYFEISSTTLNALAVFITGVTGFIHLYHVSKPFNYLRGTMFILLMIIFTYGALFQREFFDLETFNGQIGLILFLLITFSIFAYNTMVKWTDFIFNLKKKKFKFNHS